MAYYYVYILLSLKDNVDFGNVTKSLDFFSTSGCRDLLFHVQEHRFNIADFHDFIISNSLTFLGFEIDGNIKQSYMLRFPEDKAATDLKKWQIFEKDNPDTFFGMYQFWVQKNIYS